MRWMDGCIISFHLPSIIAGAHFWVGDGPQPSPKGRIVPYPQNPDDIDLFEIMNSIEEEKRKKNMQRFHQINNLGNDGHGEIPGGSGSGGGGGGGRKSKDSQPKYGRREPPYLQRMKNEDVLLKLPHGMKMRDVRWLSIWCRRFTVNYGDVYLPDNIQIPRPEVGRLNQARIASTRDSLTD